MKVVLHMGDPYVLDNPCTKRMSIFANELKSRGHEVVVLAPDTPNIEHQEGVIYCSTPPLKKKTTIYRLLNQGCLALSSYKAGKKIKDIDIVLTTCPPPLINMSAAFLAKKRQAKLIYDVRDIWPDVALEMGSFSESSMFAKAFSYIRNYMLKHADLVTAVSEGKVNKLLDRKLNNNIIQIPNGYNTDFSSIPLNKKLHDYLREKSEYVCTYIGNLGLAQGIKQFLDIAIKAKEEKLPVAFIIYGSGAEEQQLKEYVQEKELTNVSFEGRLPNKDMRTVLEASDINFVSLVNANLKDSVPTKLYEALGIGCPVLLAAEGDSARILNDTKHGVAVTPNDIEELWKGFMYIYNHIEDYANRKREVTELIEREYSLQKSAKMIADEMEKLAL